MTTTAAPSRLRTTVDPPRPLSPLGGALVDGSAVSFNWQGVPGAIGYRLQVAPDRQFVQDVMDLEAGTSTQLTLIESLPLSAAPLFWRVCAEMPTGATRWSPYGRFVPATDQAAETFRAQQEQRQAEAQRARRRARAEEEAARALVPYCDREDLIPSDLEVRSLGFTVFLSLVIVCLGILLTTLMAS